ncbi:MAG TPA: serine/threonine-protein kinase [Gaiellaceae bacterium]|nr:serine/threonine-protein kinase [Gaiellaceae bacterium]
MSGYAVDRELGRGGMAVVYAGRQEELERPVALKVLAAHLAHDDEFRTRFLREARIAARLHHPNLVRTFDITEHDGLPCIVMELLPGGTLEGGRLTRAEAAQVAAALAHAHAQGVVHRDLKPANLLRGAHGEVKIADFGVARAVEETRVTQIGTVLGTLRYLAPEQAEGREVGPEADVYSLGVVLDELLAPADPELVRRCTAPDPRSRPTAAELAERLSPTAVTAIRVPRDRRRRRVPSGLYVACVAAAAVVVAAAFVAWPRHHTATPVRPVPHGTTPAQEARNLQVWLRSYSR